MYKNIPSAEKTQLEEFIAHAYRKSFDIAKTGQREKSSKLQQKTTESRTGGQKDNSDSIKKRWVVNVFMKELTPAALSLLQ